MAETEKGRRRRLRASATKEGKGKSVMDEQAKEERVKSGSSSPKGKSCDVLIVGGGLAGLALALQLGDDDVRVILIDKNKNKKVLGNEAQSSTTNNNNKRGGGEEGGGGVLLTPANVLWARKVKRQAQQ